MNTELEKEIQQVITNLNKRYNKRYAVIDRIKSKENWERISEYQKLSEDFIREFQDKVDWLNGKPVAMATMDDADSYAEQIIQYANAYSELTK